MTPQEYADKLLEDAKEINFQHKVLNADLKWLGQRLDEYKSKSLLSTSMEERETLEKELAMIKRKFQLNVETQAKLRAKSAELDIRIEAFKKGLTA